LLGHWKNYDELESSLCIEELTVTLNAMRDKEDRDRKFHAAIQGIDLDEGKNTEEEADGDITNLRGYRASEIGFGIDMGLGYMEVGD